MKRWTNLTDPLRMVTPAAARSPVACPPPPPDLAVAAAAVGGTASPGHPHHGRRPGLSALAGGPGSGGGDANRSGSGNREAHRAAPPGDHRRHPAGKEVGGRAGRPARDQGPEAQGHRRGRCPACRPQRLSRRPRAARRGREARLERKDAGISTRPNWHRPTPTGSRPGPTFPSTRSSSRTSRNLRQKP